MTSHSKRPPQGVASRHRRIARQPRVRATWQDVRGSGLRLPGQDGLLLRRPHPIRVQGSRGQLRCEGAYH